MKNKISFIGKTSLIALTALSLEAAAPQPSHAITGLVASLSLPIATLAVLGGGATIFFGGSLAERNLVGARGEIGTGMIFFGALLLDTGNSHFELAPLSETIGEKLGINTAERAAYNSELEEVRAIHQSITASSTSYGKVDFTKAEKLWQDYRNQISPEAFSALNKVSQFTAKSLSQR